MLVFKYILLVGAALSWIVFGWSAYMERSTVAAKAVPAVNPASPEPRKVVPVRAEKLEKDELVTVPKGVAKAKPAPRKRRRYRD